MPTSKTELTQARLKELLNYDPETGVFTRRTGRGGRRAGTVAGFTGPLDYKHISVDTGLYLAHRLAFLYMTGSFPSLYVDHVNRDPGDNRWCNLREASQSQNVSNSGMRSDNTSGYRGVSWAKRERRWRAYGTVGGKKVGLGYYARIEDAAEAAREWRRANHGVFAV